MCSSSKTSKCLASRAKKWICHKVTLKSSENVCTDHGFLWSRRQLQTIKRNSSLNTSQSQLRGQRDRYFYSFSIHSRSPSFIIKMVGRTTETLRSRQSLRIPSFRSRFRSLPSFLCFFNFTRFLRVILIHITRRHTDRKVNSLEIRCFLLPHFRFVHFCRLFVHDLQDPFP